MHLALVPTSALLIPGVDPGESADFAAFRAAALSSLPARDVSAVLTAPPGADLAVASLGGMGVPLAVLCRREGGRWLLSRIEESRLRELLSGAAPRISLLRPADAVLVLLSWMLAGGTPEGGQDSAAVRLLAPGQLCERLCAAGGGTVLAGLDLAADAYPHSPVPHDPSARALNARACGALSAGDFAALAEMVPEVAAHRGDLGIARWLSDLRPGRATLIRHSEHGIDYAAARWQLSSPAVQA